MRWARYAIKMARYNKWRSRVEKICIHSIRNGVLGPPRTWPRENLLHVLEKGLDVIVLPSGKELDELDSRRVQRISLNREGYIRVDGDEAPSDYLGDLPVM